MNKRIVFCLVAILALANCNYISLIRHLKIDTGDTKPFEQNAGSFSKTFQISSASFINAFSQNINTSEAATIQKLEIESIFLAFSLSASNTATSIKDLKIELGQGWRSQTGLTSNVASIDLSKNFADLNEKLVKQGTDIIKEDLEKTLISRKSVTYSVILHGTIPAGQVLRGNISFKIKCSLDAVTCELVPIGLGPSDCMNFNPSGALSNPGSHNGKQI